MSDQVKVGNYVLLKDLYYTDSDEYVRIEGDVAVVGITDYAQKKLRDIVGVDLPETNRKVSKGDPVATIESVKAAADILSPLSGEMIEVNDELRASPEIINQDPYNKGWLFKLKILNSNEISELWKWEKYAEKIKGD
ncbi:glycine cleavage system protein H [Sulfolobales archaeon HS-7]|nr:glycine cleavage system protein H [Sulfolobales archaeon HS-7]